MTYCGNNKLDSRVVNGSLKIPNEYDGRYICFKKGIGKGKTLSPYINDDYEPIFKEKVWCGKGDLPEGYDRKGTFAQCYQKGVGVGKKLNKNIKRQKNKNLPFILGIIAVAVTILVIK
ncbi:hypothetical protein AGMMS49579_26060 [Spirochaetia bacterium]|nr:hypothetical protein AGMMS49579_26060 [Spirochaetia bacterium]